MTNRYAVTASGDDRSRSLKVTIPAKVCRALGLNRGDTFWVDVEEDEDGDAVVVKYVRTAESGDDVEKLAAF